MESVRVQKFPFRIAGIVGHPGIDIYKMQVVCLSFYFFLDDLVGKADTVDDVPAGDAGFDGNEGKGDVAKAMAGSGGRMLEKDKQLFLWPAASPRTFACTRALRTWQRMVTGAM